MPDELQPIGPDIQDPFSMVYDCLHEILIDSHAMGIVIKKENIITYNTGQGLANRREKLTDVQRPELVITSSTVSGNLNITSDTVELVRLYRLLLTTGAGAANKTINPLEWALACTLTDINYNEKLNSLIWHGQNFVKATALESVESGESDPEVNRNISNAWAAIWGVNVHMIFARQAMQQFCRGVPIKDISV